MDNDATIYRATNRSLPKQTDEIPREQSRSAHLEIEGWSIQVMGDALIVTCAGYANISLRPGQPGGSVPLGQTQVVVRRDPPASSRATEVGLQPR